MTWHKQRNKWRVRMNFKGRKSQFCGHFKDELDAAKKVNQLCEESGIPPHNPTISAIQNQQYLVTENFFLSHDIMKKSELWKFIFLKPKLCFKLCNESFVDTISTIPNQQYSVTRKLIFFASWHYEKIRCVKIAFLTFSQVFPYF